MYHLKRNHAFRNLAATMKKYSVNPHQRTKTRLRRTLKAAPNRLVARKVIHTFLSKHAPTKRASTRYRMVSGYARRRYSY